MSLHRSPLPSQLPTLQSFSIYTKQDLLSALKWGAHPGPGGDERSPRGLGPQRTGVRCQCQEGASSLPTSPQHKSSPGTLRGTRLIPPKTHFGEDPSSHPQEGGTFQNGGSVGTRVCQALGRGASRNPPAAWGHVYRPCGRGTRRHRAASSHGSARGRAGVGKSSPCPAPCA